MVTMNNVQDELKALPTIEAVQDAYRSMAGKVSVVALNISGDMNIGTMIRTCGLFGVEQFHLFGRRKYDKRGTVGANKFVPTKYHACATGPGNGTLDVPKVIEYLKPMTETHRLVFVEQYPERSVPVNRWGGSDSSSLLPPVFIVGNEGHGIPRDIIDAFDPLSVDVVEIPQPGVGRSHNVAVALGIVLYECVIRRNESWLS